jgi:hypothetical protein
MGSRFATVAISIRPRKGDDLVLFSVVGPEIRPVERQCPRGKRDAGEVVNLRL